MNAKCLSFNEFTELSKEEMYIVDGGDALTFVAVLAGSWAIAAGVTATIGGIAIAATGAGLVPGLGMASAGISSIYAGATAVSTAVRR